MIAIDKAEKEAIVAQFPTIHITRTMKQKSKRHHYYCEEAKPVMLLLNKMRGTSPTTNQKVGARFAYRQKRK